MARHGENIRKRKDGRWEGRYLVYSKEEGRKLYRSVYGRSYGEAKEKLIVKKYHLINEDEAKNEYAETKTNNREKRQGRRKGSGNGDGLKDDMDKTHIEGKTSEEIFNEEKVGGEISNEADISREISNEATAGRIIFNEGNASTGNSNREGMTEKSDGYEMQEDRKSVV